MCLYYVALYSVALFGTAVTALATKYGEWDGRKVASDDSVRDMRARMITARYHGSPHSDDHYLALRVYRDKLSQHLRHLGWLEECHDLMDIWVQSMSVIDRGTQKEGIFVDVGANIGACSIYFAANHIPTLAFEPLRSNLYYLTKAILFNREKRKHGLKSLRVFQVALGANSDVQAVQLRIQRDNYGNAMVGKEFVVDSDNRLSTKNTFYSTNATAVSWDKLYPTESPMHLLKLDCQGSETDVLKGMHGALSNPHRRPMYIYTELDPVRLRALGSSAHELMQLLISYGYKMNNDSGIGWEALIVELEEKSKKKGTLAATNILVSRADAPTIKFTRTL